MENVSVSFVCDLPKKGNSPKVLITNDINKKYKIEFIDTLTKEVTIVNCESNQIVVSGKQWSINWLIKVYREEEDIPFFIEEFNPKGKIVFIKMDATALGDNIAWIPYVDEFRKKWECTIICSTFHNSLFIKSYPNIIFVEPNTTIQNIYAQYYIGANRNDEVYSPVFHKKVPLQMIGSHLLNLPWKEIRPELEIIFKDSKRNIKEKYVCISEFASSNKKFWKEVGGWQSVVDYLNSKGYKVVVLSKEKTNLNNVIDLTDKNLPILDVAYMLYHSEFFIGVSSGLSWLAWAVNTKVVMISDCTPVWHEFNYNNIRISANPNLDTVDYDQEKYSKLNNVIDKINSLI